MGPRLLTVSDAGQANGLGVSLLQRLYYQCDDIGASMSSVTLCYSHLCNSQLLLPVSKLFYNSKLHALQDEKYAKNLHCEQYPLKFVCTDVTCEQSYVDVMADEVGKLLSHNRENGLYPKDICIITAGQNQVSGFVL